MPEEIEYEDVYSPFWPVAIFLAAFLISGIYQVVEIQVQRNAINKQYETAQPTVIEAQNAQNRLVSLANDLISTAQKDSAAAQIVREATQAGILRLNNNGNGAAPAPAPAGTDSSAK